MTETLIPYSVATTPKPARSLRQPLPILVLKGADVGMKDRYRFMALCFNDFTKEFPHATEAVKRLVHAVFDHNSNGLVILIEAASDQMLDPGLYYPLYTNPSPDYDDGLTR